MTTEATKDPVNVMLQSEQLAKMSFEAAGYAKNARCPKLAKCRGYALPAGAVASSLALEPPAQHLELCSMQVE